MSNTDGLLINNNNIYGLVNPPPAPTSKDKAKGYQDISSAAVRWDQFVDLSNNGFGFQPASYQWASIIDKIPYPLALVAEPSTSIFYPCYQSTQVLFTQTKTFSKMRLWLRGRRGALGGTGNSLEQQLPSSSIIPGGFNWAGTKIQPTDISYNNLPYLNKYNRDGMYHHRVGGNITIPDTGICEGQSNIENDGYNVWDISGPTKVAGQYALYQGINPNGWNLQFNVIITETDTTTTPAVTRTLANNCTWSNVSTSDGVFLFYNPQAQAVVKGQRRPITPAITAMMRDYLTPPLTRDTVGGGTSVNYTTVKDFPWQNDFNGYGKVGHIIHSMRSKQVGANLWYVEKDLGTQNNLPFIAPPNNLQAWQDVPVTFTKDRSYLINVIMQNSEKPINGKSSSYIGPPLFTGGLANIDALTYLELIE